MRILLAPHGTRGDVQPMLALALAARARGHEVAFVAPDNFESWIREHGFPFAPNGIDVEAVLRSPDADLQDMRWQVRHLRELLAPALFASVAHASRTADLIVGAGVQVAAGSVAELRRIPYVSAVFCPCAVPGSAAPPPFVRRQTLPPWVNRLLWRIGGPMTDRALRPPLDRARATLGLPPARSLLGLLFGDLTLMAADPDLAPLGSDAPPSVHATDSWVLDDDRPVGSEVEAFLSSGAPPVYAGFGSMIAGRVPDLAARVADAAVRAGCRLLVVGGWSRLAVPPSAGADVLSVPEVNHASVLPRVAVALHHGGAGTTTAAARAGVPQVIAPHILDQYYWAHRVEQLGIGPKAISVEALTATSLADRLRSAVADARMRERAKALAPAVASRRGERTAVDELERVARDCPK